jgi:PAS domain S-box-containing protein
MVGVGKPSSLVRARETAALQSVADRSQELGTEDCELDGDAILQLRKFLEPLDRWDREAVKPMFSLSDGRLAVPQSQWSRRVRTQLRTMIRERADACTPNPFLKPLVYLGGLGLLALDTLLSLATLPRPSTRREGRERREDSSYPIWVKLDSNFRYVDMSPEFCTLLAFSRSELIGRSAEYITPPDFTNIQAVRAEIRRNRKKKGFWIYRRSDGKLVLVQYAMRLHSDNMADLLIAPASLAS